MALNQVFGGDARFSKGKPAPVLFCVDVTGSMTFKVENGQEKDRMDMANQFVETFIQYILSVDKAAQAVEVAFVLFAHEIALETDFVRLKNLSESDFQNAFCREELWRGQRPWTLKRISSPVEKSKYTNESLAPRFSCCYDGGTKIDSAILHCYDKLLKYMQEHVVSDEKGVKKADFYVPHFVLITDGDPMDGKAHHSDDAQTHQKAVDMIYDHSYTGKDGLNMIVPITVGVFGQEITPDAIQRVKDYGENFEPGFFPVRDEKASSDFQKAAKFLCNTVVKSLNLSWDTMGAQQENAKGRRVEEVFRP